MLAAMRLKILAFFVFAACGSDADPHELGVCEGWRDNMGNPFVGMCEAGCKKPPTLRGESCDTTAMAGCASFSFDGTDGCCIAQATTIKFFECR